MAINDYHTNAIMNSNATQYTISQGTPTTVTINSGGSNTFSNWPSNIMSYNFTYASPPPPSKMNITENDIVIEGKSLKTFMSKVEERLFILDPSPENLEKYEALRNAYEQYKIIEALISKKEG